MIILKKQPFDALISYRDLLMYDSKANMQKAVRVMGASAATNIPKAEIASVVAGHLKENAEYVWLNLNDDSREILKRLVEGGSDSYVESSHDETHFTEIENSDLVVTFFLDKKKEKCRYYMIDEVRHLLKKVIEDNSDIEEIIDVPLFDEISKKMGHEFTSYSCSIPLMEDVRKADYKKQAELCLALRHYFMEADDSWRDDMFVERFMETSGNIAPKEIEDTIAWVRYAVNDMDNAISVIDSYDPMTFFRIALQLEKILKGDAQK